VGLHGKDGEILSGHPFFILLRWQMGGKEVVFPFLLVSLFAVVFFRIRNFQDVMNSD
jgi:hypothetical protein